MRIPDTRAWRYYLISPSSTFLCVSTDVKIAARQTEKHLTDEVEREKNKYRVSLPATYPFLNLGADVYALIKKLARRHVNYSSGLHPEKSRDTRRVRK